MYVHEETRKPFTDINKLLHRHSMLLRPRNIFSIEIQSVILAWLISIRDNLPFGWVAGGGGEFEMLIVLGLPISLRSQLSRAAVIIRLILVSLVSCVADSPFLFTNEGLASCFNSSCTISTLLTLDASCRGVLPLLLVALTFPPNCQRKGVTKTNLRLLTNNNYTN